MEPDISHPIYIILVPLHTWYGLFLFLFFYHQCHIWVYFYWHKMIHYVDSKHVCVCVCVLVKHVEILCIGCTLIFFWGGNVQGLPCIKLMKSDLVIVLFKIPHWAHSQRPKPFNNYPNGMSIFMKTVNFQSLNGVYLLKGVGGNSSICWAKRVNIVGSWIDLNMNIIYFNFNLKFP